MQKKFDLELRDLNREPFTAAELDALIGERDYRLFLNPRNELYRARNMKVRPPARAEAIRLMAQEPNLIRRHMVIRGDTIVFGYDEDALKKL